MKTINSHVKSPLENLMMTSWEEWPIPQSIVEPFRRSLHYLWYSVWSWPLHSQDLSIVPGPSRSPGSSLASCLCPSCGLGVGTEPKGLGDSWLCRFSSTSLGTAVSRSGNSCILIESITKSCLRDHVILMMFCDVSGTACCNFFWFPVESDIKH